MGKDNLNNKNQLTSNEIREMFLQFFENKNHLRLPSSSLIPKDDNSIMFTNSGMVQFKDVFLGRKPAPHNTTMATTSQKCLRAGGKHNDLDNVGKTARHHTFFEMLGNFSFNNYFKKEAIEYAWEFLTQKLAMNPDKLHISVFETDDEAYDIWHNHIGVPADRLVRKGEEDNFWYMGSTGPCGPCSEIHFDRGETYLDHDERFLEIWNLVFMQYYQDDTGEKTPLKHTAIDTGMGLERIASILQDTPTNYETDLFMPIIQEIEKHTQHKYADNETADIAMKVVADHARSVAFLIADGEMPSNEGSGYVLRRILRRASQFAQTLHPEPFFHHICAHVVKSMQNTYSELSDAAEIINSTVITEELQFRKTLKSGERMAKDILKQKGNVISGEDAFRMYDTYGFPVDVLADIAEQHGKTVDMDSFETLMLEQRNLGKTDDANKNKSGFIHVDSIAGIPDTEFVGYDHTETNSTILQILHGSTVLQNTSANDNHDGHITIILDRTPFYAESGGQIADTGTIATPNGTFTVTDTQKYGGISLHIGEISSGTLSKGDTVVSRIHARRRALIERNHTAAHIFFQTAQDILGNHINQAGAHINEDRLRLDFGHTKQLTPEELTLMEQDINRRIMESTPVVREEKPIDQARQEGALGIFEDKYGEYVKVISIGSTDNPMSDDGIYSKELCGGCHVRNTSELGMFFFTLEETGGAGIRRIEGITSQKAYEYANTSNREMQSISLALNTKTPSKTVQAMSSQIRNLEEQILQLNKDVMRSNVSSILDTAVDIDGITVVNTQVDPQHSLRDVVEMLRAPKGMNNSIVLVWSIDTDSDSPKGALSCGVSPSLFNRIKAGDIIKELASLAGGRGGGKPNFAQAGSKDVDAVKTTMGNAVETVRGMLS